MTVSVAWSGCGTTMWPAQNDCSQESSQEADRDLLNRVDPNQQEDLRSRVRERDLLLLIFHCVPIYILGIFHPCIIQLNKSVNSKMHIFFCFNIPEIRMHPTVKHMPVYQHFAFPNHKEIVEDLTVTAS